VSFFFKSDPSFRGLGSRKTLSKHKCGKEYTTSSFKKHTLSECPMLTWSTEKAENLHSKEIAAEKRTKRQAESLQKKKKQEEERIVRKRKLSKTRPLKNQGFDEFCKKHKIDPPGKTNSYSGPDSLVERTDLVRRYHRQVVLNNDLEDQVGGEGSCWCNPPKESVKLTCRSGKNINRTYRQCPLGYGMDGCGYFKWDPVPKRNKEKEKIMELERELLALKKKFTEPHSVTESDSD